MILTIVMAGLGVTSTGAFHPGYATQIWFSAPEPIWRMIRNWPQNDYMKLFEPNAPWPRAEASIAVFGLTKQFVMHSSDAELTAVVDYLKAHHIKLAMQTTPLMATRQCGLGSESFGPPGDMTRLAMKLKHDGADLDYMVMDEPLYFGSVWNGKAPVVACHLSIAEVAAETAIKIKAVRQIYPHVVIGDIEPMGITPSYGEAVAWSRNVAEWLDSYRLAMGEPLGYFQTDVVWQSPSWPIVLKQVAASVRARTIPLGIIYNGTPFDRSDAIWTDDAAAHFELVENKMGIIPDQAIIETWTEFPQQMLPETAAHTLTGLVLHYVAFKAKQH